ncbi:MAG: alpha/beta hydrolase [Lacunisphaera sp.]|nr:alpha/beta hydrolase [Lacunisphaera sp.]
MKPAPAKGFVVVLLILLPGAASLLAQNTTTFQVTSGSQVTNIIVHHQAPAPAGDVDQDGLPDAWELENFGHTGNGSAGDADNDGSTNLQEYQAGTNPTAPIFAATDTDNDSLPDTWEFRYFGTLDYGPDDQFNSMDFTLQQFHQQDLVPWLYTPIVIAGLRAWYRAESGYFSDPVSGKVSLWADLSGNGLHLHQPASAAQPEPIYPESGKPFMLLSGDQRMTALAADVMSGATDLTVFVVMRPDSSQAANATLFALGTGVSEGFSIRQIGSDANQYALVWPGATSQILQGVEAAITTVADQTQLLTLVKSGTTQTSYLNGELHAAASVVPDLHALPARVSVGGLTGEAFSGAIYDLLIYNRALSVTERMAVEDDLLRRNRLHDLDRNGLPDRWEKQYFGGSGADANADPDGDGVSNINEFLAGTNPTVNNNATSDDQDGDSLPDVWELQNFGNLGVLPGADPDNDGMNNLQEYQNTTRPNLADTDSDGLNDGQEDALGTDPLDPGSNAPAQFVWLVRGTTTTGDISLIVQRPGLSGFKVIGNYGLFEWRLTRTGAESGNGEFSFTARYDPNGPWKLNNNGGGSFAQYIPQGESFYDALPFSWDGIGNGTGAGGLRFSLASEAVQYGGTVTDTRVEWTNTVAYLDQQGVQRTYTDSVVATLSEPPDPIIIVLPGSAVTDPWIVGTPSASRSSSSSYTVDYRAAVPVGTAGTIRWFEVFTPADGGDTIYIARQWPVEGTVSPTYTLNAPAAGTATIEPFRATAELAVDANRDGVIKLASEDDSDVTTADQPYRFWLNDDIDKFHTFEDSAADSMITVSETEEDDIGPDEANHFNWQADHLDGRIESKRDLEDFTRLWIYTQGLYESYKNGDLRLGLKWTDSGGTTPAIKLYESIEADGSLGYLTDDAIAADQLLLRRNVITLINATTGYAAAQVSGAEVFVLPTSLFANLSETQPKTYLLFEGCAVGKGQLKFVVLKLGSGGTYTEIGEGSGVWMDLKKIGDMYEQWSVGHGNGGPPDSIAARIPALTGSGMIFKYDNGTPSPEERKYILFVHGWNLDRWEKERFAETAYTRLWWQGYKGRFGVFTWPATYGFGGSQSTWALARIVSEGVMGIGNGTHFDRGEWTAWRSGAPLRQLLQTLTGAYDGELYVFSHSMGGIVVSEALRLQSQGSGGQIIKTYVPSQAALSAHTYDATLSAEAGSPNALQWTYNHPSSAIPEANFGPQTPNIYSGWHGSVLSGGGGSSKTVGQIKNFYNRNDWALSAPVWQFNQLTKPDWPDPNNDQPWIYGYVSGLGAPPNTYSSFVRGDHFDDLGDLAPEKILDEGAPSDVKDRYEIMAFAAEPQVKALGATDNTSLARITEAHDLQTIWGPDPRGQDHRTHRWHSGQFRNYIQYQRTYWKALLGTQGFAIPTTSLP